MTIFFNENAIVSPNTTTEKLPLHPSTHSSCQLTNYPTLLNQKKNLQPPTYAVEQRPTNYTRGKEPTKQVWVQSNLLNPRPPQHPQLNHSTHSEPEPFKPPLPDPKTYSGNTKPSSPQKSWKDDVEKNRAAENCIRLQHDRSEKTGKIFVDLKDTPLNEERS